MTDTGAGPRTLPFLPFSLARTDRPKTGQEGRGRLSRTDYPLKPFSKGASSRQRCPGFPVSAPAAKAIWYLNAEPH